MRRLLVVAAVLVALAAGPAALSAQSDPRVLAAVRLAADGRMDSARATLGALEKSVAPTDGAFAQVLYARGHEALGGFLEARVLVPLVARRARLGRQRGRRAPARAVAGEDRAWNVLR